MDIMLVHNAHSNWGGSYANNLFMAPDNRTDEQRDMDGYTLIFEHRILAKSLIESDRYIILKRRDSE